MGCDKHRLGCVETQLTLTLTRGDSCRKITQTNRNKAGRETGQRCAVKNIKGCQRLAAK